jgi:hypothetical protein
VKEKKELKKLSNELSLSECMLRDLLIEIEAGAI